MADARRPVGVAMGGFGWMDRVHSQAYARVLHHFPDLTVAPRLASGARVVLEASRVAVGEQNNYGFEIHGTWVEVAP